MCSSTQSYCFFQDCVIWEDILLQNYHRMTSSNGNIFHIIGLLCGELTGHQWIPCTKASDVELWCFLWSVPESTVEQTMETTVIWDAISAYYDIIVMMCLICNSASILHNRIITSAFNWCNIIYVGICYKEGVLFKAVLHGFASNS